MTGSLVAWFLPRRADEEQGEGANIASPLAFSHPGRPDQGMLTLFMIDSGNTEGRSMPARKMTR